MRLGDFDYELPESLIAQTPMEPRDHSRLMSLCRADGGIRHHRFYELLKLLRSGDTMVFNDSRVMPARLRGTRELPSRLRDTRDLPSRLRETRELPSRLRETRDLPSRLRETRELPSRLRDARNSGGAIELLLLSRLSPGVWRAIGRPGRLLRPGFEFEVRGKGGSMRGEVLEIEPGGERIIRLDGEERLHDVGEVPLPPYITETLVDSDRYQTVYAREEGSAAAPTAGLHFTDELLEKVRGMGVQTVFVTLHVGWGTFRPVKDDDPTEHTMHAEYWELTAGAADAIRSAKAEGRRVISVGTTAVRLLENAALLSEDGLPHAGSGWADIFITPGYRFKVVDALITNFHLPRSTLLMLTSAFSSRDMMLRAYNEAVAQQYRFYSFGDAMFIY